MGEEQNWRKYPKIQSQWIQLAVTMVLKLMKSNNNRRTVGVKRKKRRRLRDQMMMRMMIGGLCRVPQKMRLRGEWAN